MSASEPYNDPVIRIRNANVVLFIIGCVLLFALGLYYIFAKDQIFGIALVAVPTAVNLLAKLIAQTAVGDKHPF